MPFTSYPPPEEIEVLMKSASFWPTDANKQQFAQRQAVIAAESSADKWEHMTAWAPFLSTGQEETRYFERADHNGDLDLKSGLLSLTSVSISGVVQERDYTPFLYRPSSKWPYTSIRGGLFWQWGGTMLVGSPWATQNRIAVTGVWGFSLEVPGSVYQAVLQDAAKVVLQQIENLQSLASISQDGFSKQYDIVGILTQKDIAGIWGKDFNALAETYKRPVM